MLFANKLKKAWVAKLSSSIAILPALFFSSGCDGQMVHLRGQLKDPNPTKRAAAARNLGEIGDSEAAVDLIHSLGDLNQEVVDTSIDALVKIGPRAVPICLSHFRNGDEFVKGNLVVVLLRLNQPRNDSIEACLIASMEDPSPTLRQEILAAINSRPSTETLPMLIDSLKDGRGDMLRCNAIRAIDYYGKESFFAVPVLDGIVRAKKNDTELRGLALRAMVRAQPDNRLTVDRLIDLIRDEEQPISLRHVAVIALRIPPENLTKAAIPSLAKISRASVPDGGSRLLRCDAIRSISKIDTGEATVALMLSIAEDEDDSHEARIESLKSLGSMKVAPELAVFRLQKLLAHCSDGSQSRHDVSFIVTLVQTFFDVLPREEAEIAVREAIAGSRDRVVERLAIQLIKSKSGAGEKDKN